MIKIKQVIDHLSGFPDVLQALVLPLGDEANMAKEHKDAWDNYTIVKHLIFNEQTDWIPRLELMISEELGEFEPFDMHGHEKNTETDMASLLSEFKLLRKQSLDRLIEIDASHDIYSKKAMHPTLGQVTGVNLMAAWIAHDQTHAFQIQRNICSQIKQEVGPWTKFMRIMRTLPD